MWAANAATGPNGRYDPGEKVIQMMVYFEWFSPMHGWTVFAPDFVVEVEQVGGSFTINGQDAGIPQKVRIHSGELE